MALVARLAIMTTHPLDRVVSIEFCGRPEKYTKEDAEAIVRARSRGVSWADVGRHYGIKGRVSRQYFERILRRHGVSLEQ